MAQTVNTKLELIQNDLTYLRNDVQEIKVLQKNEYITREEVENKLKPIRAIAYGVVALIGTIIGAIIVWAITKTLGSI